MPMSFTPTPTRAPKLGKYLGLSYILAGAVFLFDPFVSVFDLLPDCVGYLLILLGLYRLADLDDRIMDAAKGVRYLALIGLARLLALALAFGYVSPSEQPVFILLALFTLGVLDVIVLVPMWKNLCGGLLYLGSRNDAVTMFDRRKRGGKTRIRNVVERYTALSAVYFILREVLAVLPELSVLSSEKGGVELEEATRYYDFVGLFRLFGGFVSFILGVIWLVATVRFIRKLKSDTPFFERLTEKYRTEVLTRHDLFAMRAVRASFLCLIAGAVLSLDIYLDGINILPDFASAILLCLSVVLLSRYAGKNLPAIIATVGFGLTAALTWIMQITKFNMNDMPDIYRVQALHDRWQVMVLLQAATSALLVASVLLILRSLYRMTQKYTGLHALGDHATYAADRTEAIHTIIRKKLIWVAVLAILTALSTLIHWGVIPTLPEMDLTISGTGAQSQNAIVTVVTTAYQVLTEGYWFIDLFIGVVWIGTIGSAMGEITDQMEYSHMMQE